MELSPYWMANSNISINWKPQLSCISSQQARITSFSDSLCEKELIRSLFLRDICMVQDESCGTNGFSYREGPLKLAFQWRRIAWSFFLIKWKWQWFLRVHRSQSCCMKLLQDHFHVSSGGATPGTRLLWKGNSWLSPSAGRGLVPSTG